jgi:hypothetical protein
MPPIGWETMPWIVGGRWRKLSLDPIPLRSWPWRRMNFFKNAMMALRRRRSGDGERIATLEPSGR